MHFPPFKYPYFQALGQTRFYVGKNPKPTHTNKKPKSRICLRSKLQIQVTVRYLTYFHIPQNGNIKTYQAVKTIFKCPEITVHLQSITFLPSLPDVYLWLPEPHPTPMYWNSSLLTLSHATLNVLYFINKENLKLKARSDTCKGCCVGSTFI